MKKVFICLLILAFSCLFLACNSDGMNADGDYPQYNPDGDNDDDTSETSEEDSEVTEDGDLDEETAQEEEIAEFNPENPGISTTFSVIYIETMGQAMEMSVGTFTPATREEFKPVEEAKELPIDTCFFLNSSDEEQNECETDADCAEEQICHTDDETGVKSCRTEIEALDVGPITVSGFETGEKEFAYNAGQSGAYTENGAGDGSLEAGSIAFDTTYTVTGEGDESQGLGSFTGSVYAPGLITITKPEMTTNAMGMPALPIDNTSDLLLEWDGSGNPDNTFTIMLTGTSDTGDSFTISCHLSDDGSHTIEKSLIEKLPFSSNPLYAMGSMFVIQNESYGEIKGDGITRSQMMFSQMTTIFLSQATLR